jgi:hypothetical protein
VADYFIITPVSSNARVLTFGRPPIEGFVGESVPIRHEVRVLGETLTMEISKDNFKPSLDVYSETLSRVEIRTSACFSTLRQAGYVLLTYRCDPAHLVQTAVVIEVADQSEIPQLTIHHVGKVIFDDGP